MPQEYFTNVIFGLIKLKNKCPTALTMTLDHFWHVSELPGHSKHLFFDPNLGLFKLQDGLQKN